jgi:hypothetical protein
MLCYIVNDMTLFVNLYFQIDISILIIVIQIMFMLIRPLALQINPGNSKINCSRIHQTIESYIHTHNILVDNNLILGTSLIHKIFFQYQQ